ncbi:Polynucleotide 5'-hydroxyl-kinase grc3 [Dispira parvispora]|uniref:Polynucleotide 5'-hydroxyl-kinase GRC3 n=1 Tax=Dispira parvispora TaxID=1520584 RepID=A0A9W8E2F0_9FUNG|nr:Polynucleotide 5'-hydroxyl-kinase grc3 [Dispira parvispora]
MADHRFIPTATNVYYDQGVTLVGLLPNETLTFHGAVTVIPLAGQCRILEADLIAHVTNPSELTSDRLTEAIGLDKLTSYPCFAPTSHAMLTLQAIPNCFSEQESCLASTATKGHPIQDIDLVARVFSAWAVGEFHHRAAQWACVVALRELPGVLGAWNPAHVGSMYQSYYSPSMQLSPVLSQEKSVAVSKKRLASADFVDGDHEENTGKRRRAAPAVSPELRLDNDASLEVSGRSVEANASQKENGSSIEGSNRISSTMESAYDAKLDHSFDTPSVEPVDEKDGTLARCPTDQGNLDYTPLLHLSHFVPLCNDSTTTRVTNINSQWRSTMDKICEDSHNNEPLRPLKVLVTGAKGVGKSTYLRCLVNRLLATHPCVAVIDTDLGQAEFSPPGMVSLNVVTNPLLGPSFTHMLTPYYAHCFGDNSPRDNPDEYLAAIASLYHVYCHELAGHPSPESDSTDSSCAIPLVINTQGWVKGLGYSLLLDMVDLISLTHTVIISTPSSRDTQEFPKVFTTHLHTTYPGLTVWTVKNSLLGRENNVPIKQATELRQLAQMSYFYSRPPSARVSRQLLKVQTNAEEKDDCMMAHIGHTDQRSGSSLPRWSFDMPLSRVRPYTVDWTRFVFYFPFDDVPISQMLYALNGTIVGLLVKVGPQNDPADEPGLTMDISDSESSHSSTCEEDFAPEISEQTAQGKPQVYHCHPPLSEYACVGYALVRSINPTDRQLHLLTPVPASLLVNVTGLVKPSYTVGELPREIWTHGTSGLTHTKEVRNPATADDDTQVSPVLPQSTKTYLRHLLGSTSSARLLACAPYLTMVPREGLGSQSRSNRKNISRIHSKPTSI